MPATKLSWNFPPKPHLLMRIEAVFITLVAVVVFFFVYYQFGRKIVPAIALTVLFFGIYILVSQWVSRARKVEEHYVVTPTHFHAVRSSRMKSKTEKVALKDVHHHKLDKFFLGGYMLSKQGKHLLFFNTRKEVEKFEDFMKKHWKKKK